MQQGHGGLHACRATPHRPTASRRGRRSRRSPSVRRPPCGATVVAKASRTRLSAGVRRQPYSTLTCRNGRRRTPADSPSRSGSVGVRGSSPLSSTGAVCVRTHAVGSTDRPTGSRARLGRAWPYIVMDLSASPRGMNAEDGRDLPPRRQQVREGRTATREPDHPPPSPMSVVQTPRTRDGAADTPSSETSTRRPRGSPPPGALRRQGRARTAARWTRARRCRTVGGRPPGRR